MSYIKHILSLGVGSHVGGELSQSLVARVYASVMCLVDKPKTNIIYLCPQHMLETLSFWLHLIELCYFSANLSTVISVIESRYSVYMYDVDNDVNFFCKSVCQEVSNKS